MSKQKIVVLGGVVLLSLLFTLFSAKYTLVGNEANETKGLFSYSSDVNQELYYPSDYLQTGTIILGQLENGLCTAVNYPITKAYGWPFYYKIDDTNCDTSNVFPVLFALNFIFYACLVSLMLVIVRRVVRH